ADISHDLGIGVDGSERRGILIAQRAQPEAFGVQTDHRFGGLSIWILTYQQKPNTRANTRPAAPSAQWIGQHAIYTTWTAAPAGHTHGRRARPASATQTTVSTRITAVANVASSSSIRIGTMASNSDMASKPIAIAA